MGGGYGAWGRSYRSLWVTAGVGGQQGHSGMGWAEGPGMGVSLWRGIIIQGHHFGLGDLGGSGWCPVSSSVSPAEAAVGINLLVHRKSWLQLMDGFSVLFAFATRW